MTAAERIAGEWPLVGRIDVLARFRAVLDDPNSGDRGDARGIALIGAAGVGKTRVAGACLDVAEAAGWRTAHVAGSSAASSIPFGAAASLLAAGPAETDLATIIRRAHEATIAGGPLCLMVDDAHLLDDASITLVQHIAVTPDVVVVVAARADRTSANVLTSLWRDGSLARIDLDGLDRGDHDSLLAAALGGALDETSATRLFEASDGNPLFTRELLLAAVEDNALFADGHGGWRLGRLPRSSSRLAELVAGRVGSLDESERRCLETIAVAEPISLVVIDAMGYGAAVARLERRRLVHASGTGPVVDLVVSQPLYAEVARDRLPALRARNIRRSLAAALEATGSRHHGDALRIATWRLQAGVADSSANLLAAASEALMAGDVAAAERFALAAHESEPSTATALALAHAYFRAHNGDATETLLRTESMRRSDPADRAAISVLRAKNMFWLLGSRDAADAIVEQTHSDPALSDALREQIADQLAEHRVGSADDALERDPPHLRALTRVQLGMYSDALEIVRAAADGGRHAGLESFILVEGGWLASGAAAAERVAHQALGSQVPADGWAELARGTVHLADGNGTGALNAFEQATEIFDGQSDPLPRSLCVSRTVLALLLIGAADRAGAAVSTAPLHAASRIFGGEHDRAAAAVAVAAGNRHEAQSILRRRIDIAAQAGHASTEHACLHDLVRLGGADATERRRVVALAAEIDTPLAAMRARHATSDGDAAKLSLLAGEAEREGFAVWACEIAAAAVAMNGNGGSGPGREIAADQRRVIRLRSGFPRALLFTPVETAPLGTVQLRPGELQVAELAVLGLSDREISERLNLSVRTVGNYLLRAYRRLGIRGRDDLAAALAQARELN